MTGPSILPSLFFSFAVLAATSLAPAARAQSGSDTAFQQTFRLDVPSSSSFAFTSYTVPAGKRLVIKYLAVTSSVPAGQRFTSSVQATLRGDSSDFPQVYVAQSAGDGTDDLVSNQSLSVQADGGTTVYFQVFRRVWLGSFRVFFLVSGDLVPMP